MIGDVAAGSPVSGDALTIARVRGVDACRAALDEMVAGATPPNRAVMPSLHDG